MAIRYNSNDLIGRHWADSKQRLTIPAVLKNDGVLEIRTNGISSKFFDEAYIEKWKKLQDEGNLEFFGWHKVSRNAEKKPYYILHTEQEDIPMEYWVVRNKESNAILYSAIVSCMPDTYFCVCDDCGAKFIVDKYQAQFYKSKELNLPTIRCKECIEHRKNKMAKKKAVKQ